MEKVCVKIKTIITQEDQTEQFDFDVIGELTKTTSDFKLSYLESGAIPVKLTRKGHEYTLVRGIDADNRTVLTFAVGQKIAAEYVVAGNRIDLTVQTKSIKRTQTVEDFAKIVIEYDLYADLYLVGNYIFELIFIR